MTRYRELILDNILYCMINCDRGIYVGLFPTPCLIMQWHMCKIIPVTLEPERIHCQSCVPGPFQGLMTYVLIAKNDGSFGSSGACVCTYMCPY